MHWTWRVRLGALAVFAGIQFWPYQRQSNPPVLESAPMPASIRSWIRESCYDCHSNEVRWPWYSYVAPMAWWVADDVRKGRAGLNFSRWPEYSPRQRAMAWRRSLQRIREQRMPPIQYTLLHPKEIDFAQIRELEAFLKQSELSAADTLSPQEWLAWPDAPLLGTAGVWKGAGFVSGVIEQPVRLDQAVVLARGDLTLRHGITGSGAIFATGKLTVQGLSGEVGPVVLKGVQGLSLHSSSNCTLRVLLPDQENLTATGVRILRESSFTMKVPGARECRLEFCRDDGELGERIERQVIVRHARNQFVFWDPEFQVVERAVGVEEALKAAEIVIGADPATSLPRWRRRFRQRWKAELENLTMAGPDATMRLRAP